MMGRVWEEVKNAHDRINTISDSSTQHSVNTGSGSDSSALLHAFA